MALGDTAAITGLLADALPYALNKEALNIMAVANPTLFAFLGEPLQPLGRKPNMPESMPDMPGFRNLSYDFSGTQFEYRLLGQVDEPVFTPYLDPSGGYAAANWSYQEKRFNAKGNFARLILPYSFDPVKLDLISGDRAKAKSFVSEEKVAVSQGWAQKLGREIHGSSDQTDQSISGWQLALGGATGTYLGIDMSDAANVNFAAQSYNVNGNLQFKHFDYILNEAYDKGGMPDYAAFGKTDYGYMCQVLAGKFVPTDNDSPWREFKGRYKKFDGVRFGLDGYMTSVVTAGTVPFFDTRYISVFMRNKGFGMGDMMRLPQYMAVNGTFFDMYFAVVYQSPKTCVRAYGITGAA